MTEKKIKTAPWDVVDHLKSEADIVNYLAAVFEDGTPALIAAALDDVRRARSVQRLERR